MDASRQREIASKGGRAAHEKGTAHEWSSDEARVAGQKGGIAVSRDRAHMAAIGREGGESRSRASRQARDGSETDGSSMGGEREMTRSVSREGGSADRNAGSGQGSFGSSDSRDLRSDSPRGSGQPSDGR
jgi:hypothetical protein